MISELLVKACPCGRPTVGRSFSRACLSGPTRTTVEFRHPDGLCVWGEFIGKVVARGPVSTYRPIWRRVPA